MLETKEFDDISIQQISNTKVKLALGTMQKSVEFYQKEGDFFIFDTEGNCFRSVDEYNLIEIDAEEESDGGQIRAPMPGVVVQVNVQDGQEIQKVSLV